MLPSELLDIIFSELESVARKGHGKYARKRVLIPLLLVNRRWSAVALRRLYSDIRLREVCRSGWSLLPVLQVDGDLAESVHSLRLGTTTIRSGLPGLDYTSEGYASIINACPNVSSIRLEGWSYRGLETLRDTLRSKAGSLVKLELIGRGPDDLDGSGNFSTVPDFMDMVKGWTRLEALAFTTDRHIMSSYENIEGSQESEGYRDIIQSVTTCGSINHNLRHLTMYLRGIFGDDDYLQNIAVVAPYIVSFRCVWLQPITEPLHSLPTSLSLWSKTLQELHLFTDIRSIRPQTRVPLDRIFCHLSVLRVLDASAEFILLSDILCTRAPIEILYYRLDPQKRRELAEGLDSPNVLPNLRILGNQKYEPDITDPDLVSGE